MEATEVRRLGARGSASHQKRSACFFRGSKTKTGHVGRLEPTRRASQLLPARRVRMKPVAPSPTQSREDGPNLERSTCRAQPVAARNSRALVARKTYLGRHIRGSTEAGRVVPEIVSLHAPHVRRTVALKAQRRITSGAETCKPSSDDPKPPSPRDLAPPKRSASPEPSLGTGEKRKRKDSDSSRTKKSKRKWNPLADTRLGRIFLLKVDGSGQPREMLHDRNFRNSFRMQRWVRVISTEHEISSDGRGTGLYSACETNALSLEAANAKLQQQDETGETITFYTSLDLAALEMLGDVRYIDLERHGHPGDGEVTLGRRGDETGVSRKEGPVQTSTKPRAAEPTPIAGTGGFGNRPTKPSPCLDDLNPSRNARATLTDLVAVCDLCDTEKSKSRGVSLEAPKADANGAAKKNVSKHAAALGPRPTRFENGPDLKVGAEPKKIDLPVPAWAVEDAIEQGRRKEKEKEKSSSLFERKKAKRGALAATRKHTDDALLSEIRGLRVEIKNLRREISVERESRNTAMHKTRETFHRWT